MLTRSLFVVVLREEGVLLKANVSIDLANVKSRVYYKKIRQDGYIKNDT